MTQASSEEDDGAQIHHLREAEPTWGGLQGLGMCVEEKEDRWLPSRDGLLDPVGRAIQIAEDEVVHGRSERLV